MARMYPAQLPENVQFGEKMVYEELAKLPEDWVVFHDVWEHYRISRRKYVNYEADFIVLVPGYGFAVLEVKDWSHVRIVNGEWQSKSNREGAEWKKLGYKKSPLNQAYLALKHLTKGLAHAGVIAEEESEQPEHRCMAVLTNCYPAKEALDAVGEDRDIGTRHNLPLETLYLCGADALRTNLQTRILRLFTEHRKVGPRMSAEITATITNYLAPTQHFNVDLPTYLDLMDEAGAPLRDLLPMLEESTGGIMVEGCAGSGKTVLARHEAARQAALMPRDGRPRLLMLCYNHNLANSLRSCPELQRPLREQVLTVSNFHDYCEHALLTPAGVTCLLARDGTDPLSEAALAYLQEHAAEAPHYESIFVDEAQDFRGTWWELIQRWLAPGGKLYIFGDSRQQLYGTRGPLPELPTRIRLRRNLRNAQGIAQYSAAYLPAERRAACLPFGGNPLIIKTGGETPQQRAELVRACIAELRRQSKVYVANRDIVVLSPWSAHNKRSCFPHLEGLLDYADHPETAEEIEQRHLRCNDINSPKILGDTIKSFKGLEAPFVILTDICAEDESQGFNLDAFYVACTRAKYGLCIIPTPSGEALVQRHANGGAESR